MKNKNLSLFAIILIFFTLTVAIFLKKPRVNPLEPQATQIQNDTTTYDNSTTKKVTLSLKDAATSYTRNVANSNTNETVEAKSRFDQIVFHKKNEKMRNTLNNFPTKLVKHPLFLDSSWKIWPLVTAKNIHSLSSASELVVGKLNGYQLVETEASISSIEQFDLKKPIVLFDERLQRPAVLTGALIALANSRYELEKCAQDYSASIKDAFENIQTYVLSSDLSPFDLSTLKNDISRCPSVKSVRLEIIDRAYEKK